MKGDKTAQTADALKTMGYVSDVAPHIEMAKIGFCRHEKIGIGPF